ncbi:hypothetical protein K501DRAFT_95035 [Backusella circina FSU 941]|nr:hypothetical protein K501DRAFT_95035 [Backusella circina FSU 941]
MARYGAVTGFLLTVILFFMTQFFSCFILSIVECGFICYAIDIDTSMMRSSETHNIYSNYD